MAIRLSLAERFSLVRQSVGSLLSGSIQPNSVLAMVLGNSVNPPRRRGGDFLKAYSESPWLRAAVHKVAFACASVPFKLYAGKTELENPAHPLVRLMNVGIPGVLTGLSVRMLTHIHLDLLGEAFWILERNGGGVPTEAWPVPPHWVIQTPNPGDPSHFLLSVANGLTKPIPVTEMVWFKEADPFNPYLRGSSTAEALSDEISTDENAAKFINRFFYNGAKPPLIVHADGLNKENVTRMEEDWNRRNQGMFNAFRTHFLNRKVEIQVLEQNMQHLQFMELRKFERDMITQVYGVPPEVLGIIENSNRATIEAADYLMAKWVVVPRLSLFDATVQNRLIPEYDERLEYRHDDPVPENKEHSARIALDVNAGVILDVDERRKMLGEDPLPGGKGKVFLVPLNYVAVKSPGEAVFEPIEDDVPPEDDEPEDKPEDKPKPEESKALVMKSRDDQVKRILFNLEAATKKANSRLRPVYRAVIEDIGKTTMGEVGATDPFNLSSDAVRRFIEKKAAQKVTGVVRTTHRNIREAIMEGLEAEENLAQIADRIGEVFEEAKGYRAQRIARTETGRSANFATLEAYEQSEVVEKKVWLATPDSKTRESHTEANGQAVDLEDQFNVGGDSLDYPLDPSAPAEETANCRCTMVAELTNGERMYSTPEAQEKRWKQYDAVTRAWERRFRTELVRAFQELQNETMERLNSLKEEG